MKTKLSTAGNVLAMSQSLPKLKARDREDGSGTESLEKVSDAVARGRLAQKQL